MSRSDSPSVPLYPHVSFKPINTVYVLDVVHMNIRSSWCFFPSTGRQPGISLRIYLSFRSALLYGGGSNTEVNTDGVGEREREGTETRLPHERQLLVCMMDVSGYNLIEHVYPCMCGRERRLSCLSVYCDVYCIQVQDCVCARLHLQQYFNVVYDGNKRLQLCNGGKGGRMFLPSGVCFFLRLRAFH